MFRKLFALLLASVVFVSCSSGGDDNNATPTQVPSDFDVSSQQIDASVLRQSDVGDAWTTEDTVVPSTVQIGGHVGPSNVEDEAEFNATSAFRQKEGRGRVVNSVFAVRDGNVAQAIMGEHTVADSTKSWTQDREDGGTASFRNEGRLAKVPTLGDETYTAKLTVQIEDADGNRSEHTIEYVAFRIGRVISFISTQDAGVSVLARKQEARLVRALDL